MFVFIVNIVLATMADFYLIFWPIPEDKNRNFNVLNYIRYTDFWMDHLAGFF